MKLDSEFYYLGLNRFLRVINDIFAIFQQVEDSWKSMEFVVLLHRDAKDVFILGGIDDVQAALDDSQASIAIKLILAVI